MCIRDRPSARFGHGAALYHGQVVVVGGSRHKSKSPYLSEAIAFDPKSEAWSTLPLLITRRCFLTVAVACDTLFAIGGYNDSSKYLTSAEAYSEHAGSWFEVCPVPRAQYCVSGAQFKHAIFAVGGCNYGARGIDRVERYDATGDEWESFCSMLAPRYFCASAVLVEDDAES
eukprot:TRINITY_DN7853_c0_g1_i5.p1 TRINITY_DN7853_c0_g1~~TRINITY_DN7853_c0_g1_i5.p1  ORF type:complete len:172 (+),score=26.05 TRINITY_DN7853_c0_g1_i5:85-600(+)